MGKKKMIVIGPGYGHNIFPIIEELNKQTLFEVDFLCHSLKFKQEDYKNVTFIQFPKARRNDLRSCINYILFHLKYSIFGKSYDILLNEGETGFFLLFLYIFIKAKVRIFTPWSNWIIEMAQTKSNKGAISRLIFKKSDYINTNWFDSKETIEKIFPRCKIVLFYWGLSDSFFTPPNKVVESDFVKEFMKGIPDNKVMVFWPRSIIHYHRQDLVVEGLAQILKESPEILQNFILYLWPGNVEDKIIRANIEKSIIDYGLSEKIKIIDHPFVPYNDIRIIENRSDFFIQISEHDGLSTLILEMLLQEKDIILSNIPPYQKLNDYFDLKFNLVDGKVNAIATALKNKLLTKNNQDINILTRRKRICEENFKFSKNYPKFIEFMFSLPI
jgi:hypothetical protein